MKLSKPLVVAFCLVSIGIFGTIVVKHQSANNPSFWKEAVKVPEKINDSPNLGQQNLSEKTKSIAAPLDYSKAHLEDDNNVSTYVDAICGSKIPASWHVRSPEDQKIWNQEGNSKPPSTLSANDFFVQFSEDGPFVFFPPFKPALYSMAASGTALLGHSEDPGAEDSNRAEIDILSLQKQEMDTLLSRLQVPPEGFVWTTVTIDSHTLQVIQNTNRGDKYFGQELIFVPAEILNANSGLIIFNRWLYDESNQDTVNFRRGIHIFFGTLRFNSCPKDWLN